MQTVKQSSSPQRAEAATAASKLELAKTLTYISYKPSPDKSRVRVLGPTRGPLSKADIVAFGDAKACFRPHAAARRGRVVHSNPFLWPDLWDTASPKNVLYLFGANLSNVTAGHGSSLHGCGMAGVYGISRDK